MAGERLHARGASREYAYPRANMATCNTVRCVRAHGSLSHASTPVRAFLYRLVAVYRTAEFSKWVYSWFINAGIMFLLSLLSVVWIYIGLPQFIYLPAGAEFDDSDFLITTELGRQVQLVCVDETDDRQIERHAIMGMSLAVISTATLGAAVVYGIWTIRYRWRRMYEMVSAWAHLTSYRLRTHPGLRPELFRPKPLSRACHRGTMLCERDCRETDAHIS